MSFHIHPARTSPEIQVTTELVKAYAGSLGIDLSYQDFSTEIDNMPGKYAPPDGEILLAIDTSGQNDDNNNNNKNSNGLESQDNPNEGLSCKCSPQSRQVDAESLSSRVLGCAAFRPLPDDDAATSSTHQLSRSSTTKNCEFKRLYVVPSARGRGVGRALLHAIISLARRSGYSEMRLDTLDHMHGAMALYREAGFEETGAYYETPVENTVFFALRL